VRRVVGAGTRRPPLHALRALGAPVPGDDAAGEVRLRPRGDRWATADRRSPAEALAALRATAGRRFTRGPKAPAEAPLSHLVIHAEDVYRPLGVPSPADPEDVAIVLDQLTGPHADSLAPGLQEGLSFTATDVAWRSGDGPEVSGPAAALLTTLAGRTAGLSELSGDGVAQVRERLQQRRPG
jgi:hypothetical protein